MQKIKLVIGPGCDDDLRAVLPIALRADAVLFAPGLQPDSIFAQHTNLINFSTQISAEAQRLFRHMLSSGTTRLAIVHGIGSFGTEFERSLREAASASGTVVISEGVSADTSDFRSVITRLLQNKPDSFFIHSGGAESILFARQLRQLNRQVQVYSYYGIETESVRHAGSTALDGVIYTYPLNSAEDSPRRMSFDSRFRELFGNEAVPSATSYYVYDGVMVLDQALEQCAADDSSCILNFFRNRGSYIGISGDMTFRKDGSNERPFGIKQLINGSPVWISREP